MDGLVGSQFASADSYVANLNGIVQTSGRERRTGQLTVPIEWPETLVTELAERRGLIFMGAGVSIGSVSADGTKHPPSWFSFLQGALNLVHDGRIEGTLKL